MSRRELKPVVDYRVSCAAAILTGIVAAFTLIVLMAIVFTSTGIL